MPVNFFIELMLPYGKKYFAPTISVFVAVKFHSFNKVGVDLATPILETLLYLKQQFLFIISFIHFKNFISAVCIWYIVYMWYTRNKFYSEAAEENLQEAKIACEVDSPWTYNIDIDSQM